MTYELIPDAVDSVSAQPYQRSSRPVVTQVRVVGSARGGAAVVERAAPAGITPTGRPQATNASIHRRVALGPTGGRVHRAPSPCRSGPAQLPVMTFDPDAARRTRPSITTWVVDRLGRSGSTWRMSCRCSPSASSVCRRLTSACPRRLRASRSVAATIGPRPSSVLGRLAILVASQRAWVTRRRGYFVVARRVVWTHGEDAPAE